MGSTTTPAQPVSILTIPGFSGQSPCSILLLAMIILPSSSCVVYPMVTTSLAEVGNTAFILTYFKKKKKNDEEILFIWIICSFVCLFLYKEYTSIHFT